MSFSFILMMVVVFIINCGTGYWSEKKNRSRTALTSLLAAIIVACGLLLCPLLFGGPADELWMTALLTGAGLFGAGIAGYSMGGIFCKLWHNNHLSAKQLEINSLSKKLKALHIQMDDIDTAHMQPDLSPESEEALKEAFIFLGSQREIIDLRIKVLEYIEWENEALLKQRELFAVDYLNGRIDTDAVQVELDDLLNRGKRFTAEWETSFSENETQTSERIRARHAPVEQILKQLRAELSNYKAVRAMKAVRQTATGDILELPEGSNRTALDIIEEFKIKPLDQELLFERLRIESLKKIN
jgi:hypothetical protein